MTHVFETLDRVEIDAESFALIRYATLGEASLNDVNWHYGLVLEPDSLQDGCDVEELDEKTALLLMSKLFGIYIFDALCELLHEGLTDIIRWSERDYDSPDIDSVHAKAKELLSYV